MSTEEKNPWQTLSSQQQYDNPWITVTENQVINPNGGKGIYGIVHFKNIAVGIVPLDENNHTWLVGQYRYALNEYSWEIPEGGSPIGQESPLETAKRELQEETGLEATEWIEILKMHTSNSVTDEYGFAFVARGISTGLATPEETEELAVRKVSLEEAVEMCHSGAITDSLSVIALYKTKMLLDAGKL